MGILRFDDRLPSVFEVPTVDEFQNQLLQNARRFEGASKARDAVLTRVTETVTAAVTSVLEGAPGGEFLRQSYHHGHNPHRAVPDDASMFGGALKNVLGITEASEFPVLRAGFVYEKSSRRRHATWRGLAEINTPTRSVLVAEGVLKRPVTINNRRGQEWICHELVGVAVPFERRYIKSPQLRLRPQELDFYDSLEELPGDFGNWQSPMASFQ